MPLFPKIQSACPYKSNIAEMSEGERVAFLAGCEEEVCVSYSLPIRRGIRAAAVAAAIAIPTAAAAQEEMMIVVGGISAPSKVTMVQVPEDVSVPELPVLYEDDEDGAAPETAKAPSAKPKG